MFFRVLPLTIFALGAYGQGKWEFYAFSGLPGMLSYGRLDPIVSPGEVSAHVHQIQGGNAMSATYDYEILRNESTCSTIQVQDDLSNYWAPAMYHYDGVGNYSLMLARFSIYYQFLTYSYDADNIAGSSERYPFPEGLTMLAGDMLQRTVNFSDPKSTASVFQCQRKSGHSPYSHDMRDFQRSGVNCDASLRATTRFPSCWDGVADNADLTHVVYPGLNSVCPESHPYAFMQLTFEWYWPVQDFPFDSSREDNWVLSFGDTSGFGFHGDFANGWDTALLKKAIDSCNTDEVGIEKCAPFSAYQHTQIPPCMPSGLYPNENVGLDGQSLTALPGCNPLWTDNSTKPTCDATPAPKIDKQLGPDLSKWNYVSCPISYTHKGLILTAHSRTHWANMTVDSCLAECSGYKYALMEGGRNCFCDNNIQNGGSTISDPNYPCQVRCPDTYAQFCGGFGSGSLYEACEGDTCHANSALSSTAPASPHFNSASTSTTTSKTASSSFPSTVVSQISVHYNGIPSSTTLSEAASSASPSTNPVSRHVNSRSSSTTTSKAASSASPSTMVTQVTQSLQSVVIATQYTTVTELQYDIVTV